MWPRLTNSVSWAVCQAPASRTRDPRGQDSQSPFLWATGLIFHVGGHTLCKNISIFFLKKGYAPIPVTSLYEHVCVYVHMCMHVGICIHMHDWMGKWMKLFISTWSRSNIWRSMFTKRLSFFSSCSKSLKYYTILCLASPFKELWRHEAPQKSEFIVYLRRHMTDSKQATSNIWHQV